MLSLVHGDSMQDVLTQVPIALEGSGQVQHGLLRDEDLATIGGLKDDIETTFVRERKKACSIGKTLSRQGVLPLRCEDCG